MKDLKVIKFPSNGELETYHGDDRVISSYEAEEQIKLREGDDLFVIKSGIPQLDRLTDGFREGELVIVSGPTGEGKTLLAQTITQYITNRDIPEQPVWFSFEMPIKQFLRCFPSVPYFYLPAELKPYSWQWFLERCLESKAKYSNSTVIIDHLHFLLEFFKTSNPSLEIGRLVRKLKRMAVDHSFIVFLIAHVSKVGEGTKASIHHIRDSSFVSQEADTVLMIQRINKKNKPKQAIITVEKCRWTGAFAEEVYVSKVDGYLRELTDDFSA